MNDKLELKHIACYLPYGLKIQSKGMIYELDGKTLSESGGYNNDKNIFNFNFYTECDKPILRPLSDLTFKDENSVYSKECKALDFLMANSPNLSSKDSIKGIVNKTLPYRSFEFLFENHFDVFGLIEKGLAIDINTLKN